MKLQNLYGKSLVLSIAVLLTGSCTIIDNDLRDLPDTPGFKEVVHEETDEYTLDYQFLETTRVFDDRTLSYIVGIDYEKPVLYMSNVTPDDVLPSVGQIVHHGVCDQLPYGLNHRVTALGRQNEFYAVSLERAALNEVFKTLTLEGEIEVAGEFEEEEIDADEVMAKQLAPQGPLKVTNYNKDLTGKWHEFDLLFLLPSHHYESSTSPVKGKVDVTGKFPLRWRPILKAKAYIDMDKEKFDLSTSVGTEWEISPQLEGAASLEIDLLELTHLKSALSGQIPIVPQIALFLTYGFDLNFNLSLSGSIGYKFSKKSYVDFGGRYGMKAENGVYVKKHDTGIVVSEPEGWTSGWDGNLAFSASLMGGADIKLLFGSPKEFPNVGIGVKGLIGPKLRTTFAAKNQESYDKVVRTSIALKVEGTLFLNIFKNLKVDWNFTDAIAKLMGVEDGLEADIPGTVSDTRFYPSIDNMSIVCTNPKETGTPEFELSFDVLDGGMYVNKLRTTHPSVSIFVRGEDRQPILTKNDFSDLIPQKPGSYKWKFKSERLKRDVIYDAEVKMITTSTITHTWDELYSRRFPFTAASPTAMITDYTVTAQKERRAAKGESSGTSNTNFYKTYYDWKFRTYVEVRGSEDITGWGFKVGNKTYEINEPPKGTLLSISWQIKSSQKNPRTLKFIPYVRFKNGDTEMTNFMDEYSVRLEYDAEMDDYSDKLVGGYYESGFDMDDDFGKSDVDMSNIKL